ncbi:MAG: 30S ribosomal protein S12 methylthiotransferase RimO [Victivallales bacterium]|nr:30S ribosomal protein S12 methylthiotransferase RimO [Victivallales bacterium]
MPKFKPSSSRKRNTAPAVFIVSLGCPKNLVDTELMAGFLLTGGFLLTIDPGQADIYLINTCSFIPPARSEAENALLEAETWKKRAPHSRRIVVTGCLVQWDRSENYRRKFPEVDLWMGIDQIPQTAELLHNLFSGPPPPQYIRNLDPEFIVSENMPRLQLTLPHISYLKIADGCNNRCAYCAIPDIRGKLRSRTAKSVLMEAETALKNGSRELLVMAQDTTVFGADRAGNEGLAGLLREMDRLSGDFWIRLLYTHPAHFPEKLIDAIAASRHVLPYIDIPLQHISDKLLAAMRRGVSGKAIRNLLKRLRQTIPSLALRTTFITGLPGETGDDFRELRDFICEQEFERLGIFSYYPEPGTPAADFTGQVPAELAEERAGELMAVQAKISLKNNKSLVGREFDVIIDFIEDNGALGRTYMDAPEIDNTVSIPGVSGLSAGQICRAVITGADTYELTARLKP